MQTKEQRKEEENLIFGIRSVIEAVRSGKEIDRLFIQSGLKSELYSELMSLLKHHEITFQYVPVDKLNRITQKNHQGVVGYLSSISYHKIQDIVPTLFEKGAVPLILILDRASQVYFNSLHVANTFHLSFLSFFYIAFQPLLLPNIVLKQTENLYLLIDW